MDIKDARRRIHNAELDIRNILFALNKEIDADIAGLQLRYLDYPDQIIKVEIEVKL